MKELVNIFNLVIVVPSLGYLGYKLYSDLKIEENIGLMIILMTFLIGCAHIYMMCLIYQKSIMKKLK
jgi:hypothetical protein